MVMLDWQHHVTHSGSAVITVGAGVIRLTKGLATSPPPI